MSKNDAVSRRKAAGDVPTGQTPPVQGAPSGAPGRARMRGARTPAQARTPARERPERLGRRPRIGAPSQPAGGVGRPCCRKPPQSTVDRHLRRGVGRARGTARSLLGRGGSGGRPSAVVRGRGRRRRLTRPIEAGNCAAQGLCLAAQPLNLRSSRRVLQNRRPGRNAHASPRRARRRCRRRRAPARPARRPEAALRAGKNGARFSRTGNAEVRLGNGPHERGRRHARTAGGLLRESGALDAWRVRNGDAALGRRRARRTRSRSTHRILRHRRGAGRAE